MKLARYSTTIDLRTVYASSSLYARKTWQVLFGIYRQIGGNLDRMDSLLCDYDILKQLFAENRKGFTTWFEIDESGYTNHIDFKMIGTYRVQFRPREQKILIELEE